MDRDYIIQTLTVLIAEMKDYGTPYMMTDQTYFDVMIDLEDALEKAIENRGENDE